MAQTTHHRHITAVGIGADATKADGLWPVERVRAALVAGEVFSTSDAEGNVASVERYTCRCGYDTIRSAAGTPRACNLTRLRECNSRRRSRRWYRNMGG